MKVGSKDMVLAQILRKYQTEYLKMKTYTIPHDSTGTSIYDTYLVVYTSLNAKVESKNFKVLRNMNFILPAT